MRSFTLATLVAASLLASSAAAGPKEPPEVVYVNGTVLTEDPVLPRAQAVAILHGHILAVGGNSKITRLKGPHTQVVDLAGKTMTPGFVDGHSHIGSVASTWNLAELDPPPVGAVDSLAALQRTMRAYLAAHPSPADRMIVGNGYDDSLMAERRHPTADDLDAVSMDRPVCVVHVSGHLARCNHAGLRRIGLNSASPDPKGGRIGRGPNGELNGGLEEQAVGLIYAVVPEPSQAELMRALDEVQTYYASQGYTTVQDGLISSPAILEALQAASRAVNRLLALSLGSQGSCQIGGVLSSNAGGVNVLAYGNARNLALGLEVVLADGRELLAPLEWFPRLRDATSAQRQNWRLIGGGQGIHWPDVDEDVAVATLLRAR